ncbi:MAG: DUF6671 family protein [Luteibaculum sp.]
MSLTYFENRQIVIATKHRKEQVIAPILKKELNLRPLILPHLDTDLFGTFTGEVERDLDPLSTARKKCNWALDQSGYDLALASEGSFGPHPSLVFVNADDEILLLLDRANNLEIVVREISTQTNFASTRIESEKELFEFAAQVQFPSHALILRPSSSSKEAIFKGIQQEKDLLKAFRLLRNQYSSIQVETDMRALFNPSRMLVIEKACLQLVEKLKNGCPQCQTPGFGVVERKKGLPCAQCGFPTESTLSHIYKCQNCAYEKEVRYPRAKKFEEPGYCNFCNP